MIEFISKNNDPWIAETAGERLLFLLLRHHRDWAVLSEALATTNIGLAGRFNDLSNFFVGASVLHLMQRMIKLAVVVRNEENLTRDAKIELLRYRLCNDVQLTPINYGALFGELVDETFLCAEQTSKIMSAALKSKVASSGLGSCYSCGATFHVTPSGEQEPLEPTADHVWPRSLGGDSRLENLLPACRYCNSEKEHMAGWQMAWLQPAVFADDDGLKTIRRDLKIALHLRASMAYAHQNGTTLKDALIVIGPRSEPTLIDQDQGYDFFNLRVHDELATSVNWRPA